MMLMLTATQIVEVVSSLYTEHGETISIDNDEELSTYFDTEIISLIKNGELKPDYEYGGSVEYTVESICYALCDKYGYNVKDYVTDMVFDSPGLDIYVMSVAVEDGTEVITSFHNVYYWG